MASFTLAAGVFPAGSTVSVYLARNFSSDTPSGSVVTSATTASDTTTALTGLAYDTAYVAGTQINGAWRKIGFRTDTDLSLLPATQGDVDALDERLDSVESSQFARVVANSTPGATVTLDLDGDPRVWKTYTLSSASTTLDFDNAVAGAVVELWIIQPGAGGKTFSIDDGDGAVLIDAVDTDGDQMTHLRVTIYGASDYRVDFIGSGPALPTPPVNTVAPVISGNAWVGETLTTTNGTWTGVPAPTYARQWKNAGVAIGGETGTTYVVAAGDVGDAITCTVTATNTSGSVPVTSNTLTPTAGFDAGTYGTLEVDWDARNVTGLVNNDPVSTVPEPVNSRNLTASTTLRPLYKTNQFGSLPGLDFDGTDDRMVSAQSMSIKPFTFAAVLKPTDFSVLNRTIIDASAGGGISVDINVTAGTVRLLSQTTTLIGTSSAPLIAASANLLVITYDGSGNYAFRINKSAAGSGTTNLTFTSGRTAVVGANTVGGMKGVMGRYLLYSTIVSDITGLEDALQDEWTTI